MQIPDITHLQFKVLCQLAGRERCGAEVRKQLRHVGVRQTGPAFYQMMSRMERAGWVEGWYEQAEVEGQVVKTRRYRLTEEGAQALRQTREFYLESLRGLDENEGLAGA